MFHYLTVNISQTQQYKLFKMKSRLRWSQKNALVLHQTCQITITKPNFVLKTFGIKIVMFNFYYESNEIKEIVFKCSEL